MQDFLKSPWIKTILIAIAAIIIIIAGYYFVIFSMQQQKEANRIAVQNKCVNQAKITFNAIQSSAINISYTYKSHYDGNVGKCYVLMHGIGAAGTGTSDMIIDAYANKSIADCESYTTAPDQNFCTFDSPKGIYNMDEFNYFVGLYMGTE